MKKNYLKTMALALSILSWSGTTIAQNLLSEDFSSCVGTTPPAGWSDNEIDPSGGLWSFNNPGGRTLNPPIVAPFAGFDSDNIGNDGISENTALESIVFDASGNTDPIYLSFDQFFNGGASGEYHVEVFDGTAWVEVLSDLSGGTTSNPDHQFIDITTALNGASNAQIRFRWVGDWSYYWFVDNVSVDVVGCLPVTGLASTGTSATTADITWTAGDLETSWNIEWGTPGYTPGIGNEIGAASFPSTAYTINGLTVSTNYDVYVQADCGSGQSTWVGPLNIYTGYCQYSGGSSGDYINDFSTTYGASTNISNLNSGFATNGYQDATTKIVDSYEGADVDFTANFVSSTGGDFGFNIWVDWNNDFTFDPSEEVYTSGGYVGSPTTGTISIPVGTPVGNYTMRIAADELTSDPDPCSTSTYKEVEDYTFTVVAVPTCPHITDLALAGITASTADITWTAGALETSWNIEWGIPGYTPGIGNEIGAGSFPSTAYTINGLTLNTTYDVYVQADCGSGDLATWVGPLTVYIGYCQYSGGNTADYINNFSTTDGATSNISNLNSGYAPNGYQDATTKMVDSYEGADVNFTAGFVSGTGADFGFNIWVDWNNDFVFDPTEEVYASGGYVGSPTMGTISIPTGTAVGNYTMRIAADESTTDPDPCSTSINKEVEDYTFTVLPIPSCLSVNDPTVDNVGLDTIQISWTSNGTETSWNVQWGAPGFVPGTGAEIGAAPTTMIPYTINGLNSSITYDIYVQANCGSDSSYWRLVQGTTLCGPTPLPWTENFDQLPYIGPNIFPSCWNNESGSWATTSGSSNFLTDGQYPYQDFIWTPEFVLDSGVTYEFSFSYNGNGQTNWDVATYVSPSQSSIEAVLLDSIVNSSQLSSSNYVRAKFCFTPDSTHSYFFGIKLTNNGSSGYFDFDDFSLRIPPNFAGTNGATTVCQTSGLVNLNPIITINDTSGVWMFGLNPSAIQNDSLFNPASIPAGTTTVYFVTNGCYPDSATATINIYPKSNAGTDGTVSTCNYGPFNLFDGLTGNVDLGGQWYNPASQPIPGSIMNFSGEIAANYNYIYVVNNGVCPNDTSVIEIQLQDCAGVDDYELKGFVLYPNPSNGIINIQYSGKGEDVKLDVVDAKGAIVWSKQVQFNDNTTQTIDLSTVENGVYYINMTSKNGGSVMKVVKN